jgi:DNA-binding NtrC family response regulator
MTAYATNGQVATALQEGVLGIIDKPFDVMKICSMLKDVGYRKARLRA